MSEDRLALAALERKVGAALRYFELVEFHVGDNAYRSYVCIGNHCLFFLARSLAGLYPDADRGKIPYEQIDCLLTDQASANGLMLMLGTARHDFYRGPAVGLLSEHRHRLAAQLQAAWQTDHLWRLKLVRELPTQIADLKLRQGGSSLAVAPFHGHHLAAHEGYSFFVPHGFEDVTRSRHTGSSAVFEHAAAGLVLSIKVTEPIPLAEVEGGHIRWEAARQRQREFDSRGGCALVLQSQFHPKRMNLSNDVASWTGWETLLDLGPAGQKAMVALRRQYLPPLVDSAQDVYLTLSANAGDHSPTGEELLGACRLVADSISVLVHRCTAPQTLYRDMIQARLDALLFNEEAMSWIRGAVGLSPDARLERDARSFVQSVLQILHQENVLSSLELLRDIGEDIPTEKEPMAIPLRMLAAGRQAQQAHQAEETDPTANSWYSRVARYLAYCLDGGLLGPRLALADVTSSYISTPQSQQKIDEVVLFLLHVRPRDFTLPYAASPIAHLVRDPQVFQTGTFNDRVMQSLVELGWIEQALDRALGGGAASPGAAAGQSLDYAQFLARLLVADGASINLKAAVCRQLVSNARLGVHFESVCPALMRTLQQPSVYLRTYATLALATMAGNHEVVKVKVMRLGVIDTCIHNLRSGDDDLVRYTLTLLAHLTRNIGHVPHMHEAGLTGAVLGVLQRTPPSAPSKQPMLAELASVVGQLCNQDDVRRAVCTDAGKPADSMLKVYHAGPPGGRLRSKAMFALKMFVDRPETAGCKVKREHMRDLLPVIIGDLQIGCHESLAGRSANFDLDHASNALLLLGTLCKSAAVCRALAAVPQAMSVLNELMLTDIGTMDSTRDRLQKLMTRVAEIGR